MEEYLWKSCCTRTWARKLPERLSWKINCWPLMQTCKNCRTIYGLRCSRESGCRQTSCRYNQRPSEMIEFPPGPRCFQLMSFRAFTGPVNSTVTDLKEKFIACIPDELSQGRRSLRSVSKLSWSLSGCVICGTDSCLIAPVTEGKSKLWH